MCIRDRVLQPWIDIQSDGFMENYENTQSIVEDLNYFQVQFEGMTMSLADFIANTDDTWGPYGIRVSRDNKHFIVNLTRYRLGTLLQNNRLAIVKMYGSSAKIKDWMASKSVGVSNINDKATKKRCRAVKIPILANQDED